MNCLRTILFLLISLVVFTECNKSGHEHHDHPASEAVRNDENEALYDEVMKIHDEAMEKIGEIHRLKKILNDKINSQALEKTAAIGTTITQLDSADKGMFDWMHDFNPPGDTMDKEAYREYMESELEKIKKVRQDIIEALQAAEEEISQ